MVLEIGRADVGIGPYGHLQYITKQEVFQVKSITIDKLSIRNFKGCGSLELTFGGKDAAIYGDNAAGKTTVYDALTWLLFGKDSRGGSDQETIKPLDRAGNVRDHQAVTCVEAVFGVREDGAQCAPLQLRKEMQESWVTRRGSAQPVYDGNDFRYYVDDVPMKKNEFARRVGELVEEDTFRMLTSVTAFAQDMPWKKRREILYDMSGAVSLSDRALLQVAARENGEGLDPDTKQRFSELAELMGSKSLDDLKKILDQKRKNLMGTRDQTPARIDELTIQEARMADLDFDQAELQKAAAEEAIRNAREELARLQGLAGHLAPTEAGPTAAEIGLRELKAEKASYEAAWSVQRSAILDKQAALTFENAAWVRAQRDEALTVEREILELDAKNRTYRQEQAAALPDLNALQDAADGLADRIRGYQDSFRELEAEAAKWDELVEQNRREWLEADREIFSGGNCPTCGQQLPLELLAEAKAKFAAAKAGRLTDIEGRAKINRGNAERCRTQAADAREKAELAKPALEKALNDLEAAKQRPREILDLEGYTERREALTVKQAVLEGQEHMPDFQARLEPILEELAAHDSRKVLPGYDDRLAVLLEKLAEEQAQAAREADEEARRKEQIQDEILDCQQYIKEQEAVHGDAVRILGQRVVLDYTRKRIQELREAQKASGAELEQVAAALYAMEAFIRWKTHFVEDSINELFRIVTFRLFREQANGALEERCDVVVDGVPYNALNNGTRINAGLDIIRRLAEHYGVRVPLFVDNAEGVTRLEDAETQVIRLVVSEQDKSLRMVME